MRFDKRRIKFAKIKILYDINDFIIESLSNRPGWHATDNGIGRNIFSNQGTSSDDGTLTNSHAINNCSAKAHPDIVF